MGLVRLRPLGCVAIGLGKPADQHWSKLLVAVWPVTRLGSESFVGSHSNIWNRPVAVEKVVNTMRWPDGCQATSLLMSCPTAKSRMPSADQLGWANGRRGLAGRFGRHGHDFRHQPQRRLLRHRDRLAGQLGLLRHECLAGGRPIERDQFGKLGRRERVGVERDVVGFDLLPTRFGGDHLQHRVHHLRGLLGRQAATVGVRRCGPRGIAGTFPSSTAVCRPSAVASAMPPPHGFPRQNPRRDRTNARRAPRMASAAGIMGGRAVGRLTPSPGSGINKPRGFLGGQESRPVRPPVPARSPRS